MKSSLSALSGPRVRIAPQAALALAKRRLPLRSAHGVVTRLYDHCLAVVELPAVENAGKVIRDLASAGVTATPCRG